MSESLPPIDGVTLQGRIGRGGMADVYRGFHKSLRRRVAVKILHSHLVPDPEIQRRFHSEARAVAGLRHQNIVQVFDFGLADGRPYIVMELIDGPTLAHTLSRAANANGLPVPVVQSITSQLAEALDHAHAQGIVHRDLKPANVILRHGSAAAGADASQGLQVVLTDFGVTRISNATSATATGTLLGTPAYMAPEQIGRAHV